MLAEPMKHLQMRWCNGKPKLSCLSVHASVYPSYFPFTYDHIISTPSFAALVVGCRIDLLPAHLASTARAREAGEDCAGEILLHGVARVALGTLVVSCSRVLTAGFSRNQMDAKQRRKSFRTSFKAW